MFGVSGGELIILLLIGLVVLGPERLPRVANQIGGWLGQARRMTRVMKRQLEEELDLNETLNIKSPPPPAREPSSQPEKAESESPSPSESPEPDPILRCRVTTMIIRRHMMQTTSAPVWVRKYTMMSKTSL